MNKKLFLLLLFILSFIPVIYGQKIDLSIYGIETKDSHVPAGLNAGDMAPDFTGYDQTGKQVTLKKCLENGPLVLFFYRGNWSPVCNKYLKNYQDSLRIITDQGFNLIAITPESIENVEQTVKINNLSYTVIYDCQEQIMKDYDVMFNVTQEYQNKVKSELSVDIAGYNGRDTAHLPVPATFIINKQGIIVAVQFDPDYQNRASVEWILQHFGLAL